MHTLTTLVSPLRESETPQEHEKRDETMASLLILKALTGEQRGQEFAFALPTHCILGRSRSCMMRLAGDATVSRQHCLIEFDEHGAWVQDLGSLNGTHLNGERIGRRQVCSQEDATMVQPLRQPLHSGDELRVCNLVFAVELAEGEPVPHPGVDTEHSGAQVGVLAPVG